MKRRRFFDPRCALSIARKELRHILRDPISTIAAFVVPVALVCFFGFAIDFEVRHVDILVSDSDHTRMSRELVDMFDKSGYFRVRPGSSVVTAAHALAGDRAKAVLIIPPEFQRDLLVRRPVRTQIMLDGADDQMAAVVTSYLAGLREAARSRLARARPALAGLRTRFLFNEELNSQWFVVPGLFVTTLGLFSTLLPAMAVAREWENGSMELLLATPVRALEILAGKMIPYFTLCAIDAVVIYLLARLVFHVPFLGSHLVFVAATTLFLVANLAQGLMISVVTRSQRLAYQSSMQVGNLPSLLLSGFVFPIENMPLIFQWITFLLPARWYMIIVRSTFLRAPTFDTLLVPMASLAGIAVVLVGISLSMFKMDLEP